MNTIVKYIIIVAVVVTALLMAWQVVLPKVLESSSNTAVTNTTVSQAQSDMSSNVQDISSTIQSIKDILK
ncbi:hypothetical protein EPN87_02235 [archaeon]|nr:MAG: hypothetical protein EPN87_02235 [archaeon]